MAKYIWPIGFPILKHPDDLEHKDNKPAMDKFILEQKGLPKTSPKYQALNTMPPMPTTTPPNTYCQFTWDGTKFTRTYRGSCCPGPAPAECLLPGPTIYDSFMPVGMVFAKDCH